MATQNNMDLTQGKPFSVLLKFAIPVILGNLFQLFYTLADSVIVGKTMGAGALAAVGSTSIIIYFIFCFINGFTGGFGICLGQRFGARDQKGMTKSIAVSAVLCVLFTILLTAVCCLLAHPILRWMQIPADIYDDAYTYMFIVLAGTGATIYYNMISNMLRALGDSKTPLYFLVFSSLLNIVLDVVFILPLQMGVAFQMSVMCIGQLAMQAVVNSMGTAAVAGYTAATKADQLSVLVNNAMMTAISNYVAQNYGAGLPQRIQKGVRACLIQLEVMNLVMCIGLLLLRHPIVRLFLDSPSAEIYAYSDGYLWGVAPFYFILGLLAVYRTAIQSMQNSWAPFSACMIELIMRLVATLILPSFIGYTAVCIASPLAWAGACILLIPVYYHMMRKGNTMHQLQA